MPRAPSTVAVIFLRACVAWLSGGVLVSLDTSSPAPPAESPEAAPVDRRRTEGGEGKGGLSIGGEGRREGGWGVGRE